MGFLAARKETACASSQSPKGWLWPRCFTLARLRPKELRDLVTVSARAA